MPSVQDGGRNLEISAHYHSDRNQLSAASMVSPCAGDCVLEWATPGTNALSQLIKIKAAYGADLDEYCKLVVTTGSRGQGLAQILLRMKRE